MHCGSPTPFIHKVDDHILDIGWTQNTDCYTSIVLHAHSSSHSCQRKSHWIPAFIGWKSCEWGRQRPEAQSSTPCMEIGDISSVACTTSETTSSNIFIRLVTSTSFVMCMHWGFPEELYRFPECGCYSVTFHNNTLIFNWCGVTWGSKRNHHNNTYITYWIMNSNQARTRFRSCQNQ